MKYNHAYTIAFSLENSNKDGDATDAELFTALKERIRTLELNTGEIQEAAGGAFDTFEVDETSNEKGTNMNNIEKAALAVVLEFVNAVADEDMQEAHNMTDALVMLNKIVAEE